MNRHRANRALISAAVVRTGGGAVTEGFARELERQLGSLLRGGLEPYAFRRWFASALWAAEGSADSDTLDVATRSRTSSQSDPATISRTMRWWR